MGGAHPNRSCWLQNDPMLRWSCSQAVVLLFLFQTSFWIRSSSSSSSRITSCSFTFATTTTTTTLLPGPIRAKRFCFCRALCFVRFYSHSSCSESPRLLLNILTLPPFQQKVCNAFHSKCLTFFWTEEMSRLSTSKFSIPLKCFSCEKLKTPLGFESQTKLLHFENSSYGCM